MKMVGRFTVRAQLPSLNDFISRMNYNRFEGAKMKRDVEETISWGLLEAKREGTLRRITEYPVELYIEWHEKDARRDVDNIESSSKFLLDAMKNCGVIKDDARRYISQVHSTVIDDLETYVVVKITKKQEDNMNEINLTGRLTRDPELEETPSGIPRCRFSIAVRRDYANSDGEYLTDFFDCTAFRSTAEAISKYCKKGEKILVNGTVQMRTYEDNQGIKRKAIDVVAQRVEFFTRQGGPQADDDGETDGAPPHGRVGGQSKRKPTQTRIQSFDDDGDIPF